MTQVRPDAILRFFLELREKNLESYKKNDIAFFLYVGSKPKNWIYMRTVFLVNIQNKYTIKYKINYSQYQTQNKKHKITFTTLFNVTKSLSVFLGDIRTILECKFYGM